MRQSGSDRQEDHGLDLGSRIVNRRAPRAILLRDGWLDDGAFQRLWARIGRRIPFVLAADSAGGPPASSPARQRTRAR